MNNTKEIYTIGGIIFGVICFALGVSLSSRYLGAPNIDNLIDVLSMLGGWASGIGAFIAAFVALKIADRQNNINLLEKRKEIYSGFFALQQHMLQEMLEANREEVIKFYKPSRDAVFYFSKSLSKKILDYYSFCFQVSDLAQVDKAEILPNERIISKSTLKSAYRLAGEIEVLILQEIKRSSQIN